jgi:gliding motility-associated-like protein
VTSKYLYIILASWLAVFAASAQSTFTVTLKTYSADCQLGAAAVKVEGGVAPYNIQWSHGALGDTVSSLGEGSYSVHISDSGNPAGDTTVSFTIDPRVCKVSFNNRFTPNNDGINDTWGIGGGIADYPKFLLQVFDRWGQLVHEQRGTHVPWDGTHLGLKVPDATYYFIFFYEEGKKDNFEKGSVTIVR